MQTTPKPDIEGMLTGGQVRLRRRNTRWVGLAAAAALIVGGGSYGVAQIGDSSGPDISVNPTETPTSVGTPPKYLDRNARIPEPGTYRKEVGFTSSGAVIEADLTFEDPDWFSGGQPVISTNDDSIAAGLGVFEARTIPGTSGCTTDHTGDPTFQEAATTLDALGRQLVELPSSAVVQPLTPTVAFGHDARHLRLRIDTECPAGEGYVLAVGDPVGLGLTYTAPWRVVVDFLVVDIDGTAVVVALWHDTDAPKALVDEANRVRESIAFVE